MANGVGGQADLANTSWEMIQEIIATGTYPAGGTITGDYWWKNGGTPTISDWDDLWKYSIQAVLGVGGDPTKKVPDAFDGFDQTALDDLVSGKPGTSTATNVGWFRTGDIDPSDDEHAMEFTVADFVSAWTDPNTGVLAVLTAPSGPYTAATVTGASWLEIQWALINGSYKKNSDIFNDPTIDYWWKDGGKPALTYEKFAATMMDHAFNGPSQSDMVDLVTTLDAVNDQLRFRADEFGSVFTDLDEFFARAKTVLYNVTDAANRLDFMNAAGTDFDMTWEEFQWLLINYSKFGFNDTLPSDENSWTGSSKFDPVDPSVDFWWKTDTGTPPHVAIAINSLSSLLQGSAWTWGSSPAVNDEALKGANLVNEIKALNLRKPNGSYYDNASDFLADMENAFNALLTDNGGDYKPETVTKATWLEVQNVLMGNPFRSDSALAADPNLNIWWKDGGKYPITDLASLLQAADLLNQGISESDAFGNFPGALWLSGTPNYIRSDNDGTSFTTNSAARTKLAAAVDALISSGAYTSDTVGTATWEEVQYAVINGSYKSAADIAADSSIAYWWKDGGTKPNPGGPSEKEIPAADWATFMDAINDYWVEYDANGKLGALMASDPGILNRLLLKDTGGSDFTDGNAFMAAIDDIMYCFEDATNQSEFLDYTNNETNITWWEFQYAILHRSESFMSKKFPHEADIKADPANKYEWKFDPGSGGGDGSKEKEIPAADWATFMDAINDYWVEYDANGKLSALMASDPGILNRILLHDTKDNTFADGNAFMAAIDDIMYCFEDATNQSEFLDYTNNETNITWWEFQYAVLHRSESFMSKKFPHEAEIKANDANKYEWKYESGSGGGGGGNDGPKEKEIPLADWLKFMEAVNDYWVEYDANGKLGALMSSDPGILDRILLQDTASSSFADGNAFIAVIDDIMYCFEDASNQSEFLDYTNNETNITWWEFQYAVLHRNESFMSKKFPHESEIKADDANKYAWKYESGSGGGGSGGGGGGGNDGPKEKEVPAADWSKFMDAVADYWVDYDNQGKLGALMSSDPGILDRLFLQFDDTRSFTTGEFMTMVDDIMYSFENASNQSDFLDYSNLKTNITWWEFQYAIIHWSDGFVGKTFPHESEIKANDANKYAWKYESDSGSGGSGGGGNDGPKEKEVPAADWAKFTEAVADYWVDYDANGKLGALMSSDPGILDRIFLRDTATAAFADASAFLAAIDDIMYCFEDATNQSQYLNYSNTTINITWWELQYAILHRNESFTSKNFPNEATIRGDEANNYPWKYEGSGSGSGGGSGGGGSSERPVSAATWSLFMTSVGKYYESQDPGDFTFPLTDTVIADDLLLRKDLTGTAITVSDLLDTSGGNNDLIFKALDAIYSCSNGATYIDQIDYTLNRELTWYEFQYAVIHYGTMKTVPDETTIKAECSTSYSWKYSS